MSICRMAMILICMLLLAAEALPFRLFDNRRQGFFVDIGLGPGVTTVTSDYYEEYEFSRVRHRETKGALAFDLRFGGASEQFRLYLMETITIFDMQKMIDDYGNYFDKMSGEYAGLYIFLSPFVLPFIPLAASHANVGFGASYFFEPGVPSFFIDAGFGGSIIYDPFRDKVEGGRGFVVGLGYESDRHWLTRAQFQWGQVPAEENISYVDGYYIDEPQKGPEVSAISFTLTINYSFY
jgi:hypothetical protein